MQTIAWRIAYIPELALAALPAIGKTFKLHAIFATLMGIGMFSSGVIFTFGTDGTVRVIEVLIVMVMGLCTVGTLLDRKRSLFYELLFIFSAHFTILIAIFDI